MGACTVCGRNDAHSEQRKTSTTNLPFDHCYHFSGNAGPFKCCWCGEVMPSSVNMTSGAAFYAHGPFTPHGGLFGG